MASQGLYSSLIYAEINMVFRLFFLISCFRVFLISSLDPGEGFLWEIVIENYVRDEYPKKRFGRRDRKADTVKLTLSCEPEKSWELVQVTGIPHFSKVCFMPLRFYERLNISAFFL